MVLSHKRLGQLAIFGHRLWIQFSELAPTLKKVVF
jgi:hypothetical protein